MQAALHALLCMARKLMCGIASGINVMIGCLQDERLAVAALWQPSLLWTAPAWLTTADPPRRSSAETECGRCHAGEGQATAARRRAAAAAPMPTVNAAVAIVLTPMWAEVANIRLSAHITWSEAGVRLNTWTQPVCMAAGRATEATAAAATAIVGGDGLNPPRTAVQQPWASADVFADLDRAFAASSGFQSRRRAMDLLQRGVGKPAVLEMKAALEAEFIPPAAGDNPVHVRARVASAGAILTVTALPTKSVNLAD